MKILDQHGTPIDTGVLREPQTARVSVLQHELVQSQLDGLTPTRAARILKDADQGDIVAQHRLFDDMLDRDAHLRCEYDKRAGALLGLDWSIEPPAGASRAEKKAAAMVEALLRDTVDDLEDVLTSLMEAPGHGFAAVELEWQRWGTEWLPKFHPRPQTWFRTDAATRRELRLYDGSAEGAVPTPMGWVLHTARKPKTGYLGRLGLFRAVLWPFLYKAYSIGDFAEFLETYGLPIILGRYMAGAQDEEKASLLRAVTALGHDARAIMPDGMSIEIQKITGGGEGSHHLNMVDWAERSQSKAILGQVLSSEARATGMGSGVADLHREVRADIREADARQLAGTLTRDLVYPLIALNIGGIDSYRRCPRWVFDLGEAEDLQAYADALPTLAAGGARIPVRWVHEKLRIPEAEPDEPVFGAPPAAPDAPTPGRGNPPVAPAVTPGTQTGTGNGAGAAPFAPAAEMAATRAALAALAAAPVPPAPDALDNLVDEALADWQPMMQPAVDAIQAELDASAAANETAQQLLARIVALLPQLDMGALAERLDRAAFAARLAGEAGMSPDA